MKGLPNYGNYCFLNTAVQQLYDMKNFREKILALDTEDKNSPLYHDTKTYRQLISLRKLFKFLAGESNLGKNEIKLLMKDLGYKEEQEDSAEIRDDLLKNMKLLFKKLKGKELKPTSLANIINVTFQSGKEIDTFIEKLCDETLKELKSILTVHLRNECMIVNIHRTDASASLIKISPRLELGKLVADRKVRVINHKNSVDSPNFHIKNAAVYMPGDSMGAFGHYFNIKYNGSNNWAMLNDENVREGLHWKEIEVYMRYATSIIYELV